MIKTLTEALRRLAVGQIPTFLRQPDACVAALIFVCVLLAGAMPAAAATTISSVDKFGYGANIGWINWSGDVANGAQIGEFYCSGYIYSANVGWISLGSGNPGNGYAYANNSATDYGVNTDADGNLRGYAYGANIGWINFDNLGAAKVNRRTGQLSGYAYSANCGWLSLSNALASIRTDSLWPGPLAIDGLPVAWRSFHFGIMRAKATDDWDNDGANNLQEYLAGTHPRESESVLKITRIDHEGERVRLVWQSVRDRNYLVEESTDLREWTQSRIEPVASAGVSTDCEVIAERSLARYYRIQAIPPF